MLLHHNFLSTGNIDAAGQAIKAIAHILTAKIIHRLVVRDRGAIYHSINARGSPVYDEAEVLPHRSLFIAIDASVGHKEHTVGINTGEGVGLFFESKWRRRLTLHGVETYAVFKGVPVKMLKGLRKLDGLQTCTVGKGISRNGLGVGRQLYFSKLVAVSKESVSHEMVIVGEGHSLQVAAANECTLANALHSCRNVKLLYHIVVTKTSLAYLCQITADSDGFKIATVGESKVAYLGKTGRERELLERRALIT